MFMTPFSVRLIVLHKKKSTPYQTVWFSRNEIHHKYYRTHEDSFSDFLFVESLNRISKALLKIFPETKFRSQLSLCLL